MAILWNIQDCQPSVGQRHRPLSEKSFAIRTSMGYGIWHSLQNIGIKRFFRFYQIPNNSAYTRLVFKVINSAFIIPKICEIIVELIRFIKCLLCISYLHFAFSNRFYLNNYNPSNSNYWRHFYIFPPDDFNLWESGNEGHTHLIAKNKHWASMSELWPGNDCY